MTMPPPAPVTTGVVGRRSGYQGAAVNAILSPRPIDTEDRDPVLRLRDIVAWGEPWDYEDDVEDPAPSSG
ncbi:MAG: hypothetical protein NVS3B12_16440 [Acidimicrobiales bacterium]